MLRNITNGGWKIINLKNNIIYIKKDDVLIGGHLINYKDKIVLDVGGFIGYSALLFSKWGAKK